MGVPVWLTAAAQYTERIQSGGVQDMETGVLAIHHQQSFRVFGTAQSLSGMRACGNVHVCLAIRTKDY